MDWKSWSQICSKKSTTTVSRRPLRRRRKNLRWRRMYLLLQADQRLKQDHEDLLLLAHLQERTNLWKKMDWYWARNSIKSRVPSSKKIEYSSMSWSINSKRRWSDRFWRLKDDFRNNFEHSQHWSVDMWKSKMAGGKGNMNIFQNCTDPSGKEILDLRALQGHSGRNPIDPILQDNVLIPNNFFEYIYHIGCAISLHFFTNSGLIRGGQNSSRERQDYSSRVWTHE